MEHSLFLTDLVPVSDYAWCTVSDDLISHKNVVGNSENAVFFPCNSKVGWTLLNSHLVALLS